MPGFSGNGKGRPGGRISLRALRDRLKSGRNAERPVPADIQQSGRDDGRHSLNAALGVANPDKKRFALWLLVLEAKGYDFEIGPGVNSVFVPEAAVAAAAEEIREFEAERYAPERQPAPGYENWIWVLLILSFLLLMDLFRRDPAGWQLGIFPPNPEEWLRAGAVYTEDMRQGQGLYRAFTALTMHADGTHLLGNLLTGALFLVPLCRQVGLGYGFFITIIGGGIGNVLNVLVKRDVFVSIGFSTALFAALGGLCAVLALQQIALYLDYRRSGIRTGLWANIKYALAPMAAGLGFLAIMGGSGDPDTDYGAHIMGFVAGIIMGLVVGMPARSGASGNGERAIPSRFRQGALLLLSLGVVALSWALAMRAYHLTAL